MNSSNLGDVGHILRRSGISRKIRIKPDTLDTGQYCPTEEGESDTVQAQYTEYDDQAEVEDVGNAQSNAENYAENPSPVRKYQLRSALLHLLIMFHATPNSATRGKSVGIIGIEESL